MFRWNAVEIPKLIAEASSLKPLSHGLIILPFLNGERAPGWNDNATASIIGLTWKTRPAEVSVLDTVI
jgi:ribulose kinase